VDSDLQPSATKISNRKHAANQANARKSTGPRSTTGKQATRFNACKHGLAQQQVFSAISHQTTASIAEELPTHSSQLPRTIATCFDTLQRIHQTRSNYIREADLEDSSFDELNELIARMARLERYERSASSRLAGALIELLVLRARPAKRTQGD
jgi:hypothetical protein